GQAIQPRITRVAPAGDGTVVVNWICPGCTEPSQLQCRTLSDTNWQDVGCVTMAASQTNIQAPSGAIYRVANVNGFSTRNDKSPPSQVTNLTATALSSNQINLS